MHSFCVALIEVLLFMHRDALSAEQLTTMAGRRDAENRECSAPPTLSSLTAAIRTGFQILPCIFICPQSLDL